MKENSRTKNSIINSIYASLSQTITILLSFIVRTVFIKNLSASYLGVNGLFSNIITMISLADLGIGISIPYTLYKPLAENDKERIKSLMRLYAKIYNIIGIIVLFFGVLLIPFLPLIIKEMPDIPNIQFIYLLFIINSSVSYFFIYKKLLLDSDQKGYIANKIIMNTNMIKSIGEVIILVCTKNYILYLSIAIIATIIQNIFISARCNKLYPYLREETKERVEKDTIKELKNNTSASVLYRLGIVALNGTDNIIISKFIGIAMVGIYSNYLLIVNAISNVISQVFSAITSSVGNMVVKESSDKSEKVFYQLQFLNFWLYTIFAICITILINPFIKMWAGEEYVLNTIVAFSVGLNLYIYGMQGVVTSYRNAYGLFVQGKYRPIIMAIVNIVVSIILAKCMGILGVIIGTIISRLFILGIYDPVVVFRYGLKKDVKKYFISYIQYLLIYIIISMTGVFLFKYIEVKNYIIWIISALCAVVCINLVLVLLFFKSENFIFYKEKLVNIIRKMR